MTPSSEKPFFVFPVLQTSHDADSTADFRLIGIALQLLAPHLPVALPLYRRLQAGHFSAEARLLTNLDLRTMTPSSASNITAHEEWMITYLDRASRPETEAWMFGNWETRETPSLDAQKMSQDVLIRGLARAIKTLGVPESIHQETIDAELARLRATADERDTGGFSRDDYASHLWDSNVVLLGAVHTATVAIFVRNDFITSKYKTGLVPNHNFMFNVDALPPARTLPEGLRWGTIQPEHRALIRSRTQIPRQDRTLAKLKNMAIFDISTDMPIAWAFVGLDASLTSLHVEPTWRGQGLAKAVATKLFKDVMDDFWEEGKARTAHAYVMVGNDASCGVSKSLGGVSQWEVIWARVDIGTLNHIL